MSGQLPPDWEDPDDGHSDAGLPDGEHPDPGYSDVDLPEVTSLLASVGSTALPASFEARISAAIAAEAAARATTGAAAATEPADAAQAATGADAAKGTGRSANPEEFPPAAAAALPATSTSRRPRRGSRASRSTTKTSRPQDTRPDNSRRRRLRMPSTQAAGWALVCCLVLAGFGFLVTHGSGSSTSSEAASAASSQSASADSGARVPQPAAGRASEAKPGDAGAEPSANSTSGPTGFLVYSTGTVYKRSTLASMVRGQLVNYQFSAPAPAASSSTPVGTAPSPQLSGCVSALTGGAAPSLVDKASYDGIPAYIIAVPTEVWVVRLGCTSADTRLIVREPLKG